MARAIAARVKVIKILESRLTGIHANTVLKIARREGDFAANDFVLRARVPGNIDVLDISSAILLRSGKSHS
jgi:hypothetical protein